MGAVIEVRNLSKRFGKTVAVDNVSLTVPPGQILGLVGPNGAGKSTLLRCLVGILKTDEGSASVAGHDTVRDAVEARRALAYAPEVPAPYLFLTPWEHLLFTARVFGLPEGWQARAEAALASLDLAEKRDELARSLSKGQRQKVHLAMAMIRDPQALVLDEPLIGLDPKAIRVLKGWVRAAAAAGAAGVVSSHSLPLVEEVCDRVAVMHRGRIVAEGSVADLKMLTAAPEGASLEDVFLAITQGGELAREP
ncbi:MAG TPA: ABC transporter ATP-binding protein [Candidatus Thermoplasmatota archaeon]